MGELRALSTPSLPLTSSTNMTPRSRSDARTRDDGTEAVFHISGAEFFQQEFQAEGTRVDDDADYRFVSSDDNETILVGRKGPEDSGWSMVGSILDTAPAESE